MYKTELYQGMAMYQHTCTNHGFPTRVLNNQAKKKKKKKEKKKKKKRKKRKEKKRKEKQIPR